MESKLQNGRRLVEDVSATQPQEGCAYSRHSRLLTNALSCLQGSAWTVTSPPLRLSRRLP